MVGTVYGRMRALSKHRLVLFASLLLVVAALLIIWRDGAAQPYVPDTFSYNVEFNSTDNYYDRATSRYTGTRYGRGQIYYSLGQRQGQLAPLGNVLKDTDLSGNAVATIRRNYTVNTATGRYILPADRAEPLRQYIFAPRNLERGHSFVYRHVTYDAPARMQYEGEETINGLQVYRYNTTYPDLRQPLAQLDVPQANIPDGQGIAYSPNLTIWVEPVTGWLVKFKDDTVMHYYDLRTGKQLEPFNHFTSVTTEQSIAQQAAYAKTLRYHAIFVGRVVPQLLLVGALAAVVTIAIWRYKRMAITIRLLLVVIEVSSMSTLGGWLLQNRELATLFLGGTAMSPLSSLSFLLTLVVILLLYRGVYRRVAVAIASVLVLGAAVELAASAHLLPSGFNLLNLSVAASKMGQPAVDNMTPFAALTWLIFALAVLRATIAYRFVRRNLAVFGAGVAITLGTLGLLIQLFRLDEVFTLDVLYPFSAIGALLFILSGFALIQVTQTQGGQWPAVGKTVRSLVWPALATIPLVGIGIIAQLQQNNNTQQLRASFMRRNDTIVHALANKVDLYTAAVVGGRGLFSASPSVNAVAWSSFTNTTLQLTQARPGLVSLGYAQVVPVSGAATYTTEARAHGDPAFKIYPTTAAPVLAPVRYIEPANESNRKLVGYDLLTDQIRGEAMDTASASGHAAISGGLDLAIDSSTTLPGFSIFAPVYKNGASVGTAAGRQAALQGYTFGLINLKGMVKSALGSQLDTIDFQIYDGLHASNNSRLYDRYGSFSNPLRAYTARFQQTQTIYENGHAWTIVFSALPSFTASAAQERLPAVLLICMSMSYLAVCLVLYVMLDVRRQRRGMGAGS